MTTTTMPHFDGKTYDPSQDHQRLTGQLRAVYDAMKDGCWHSLAELEVMTGRPQASISARLRDLRKAKFGGHDVRRRRCKQNGGQWKYCLIINI